jgi:hypothetical protein
MQFDFLDKFSKNSQIWNYMKILPVGSKLFHADGQTHMTNLTVAFRDFTNAPKNEKEKKLLHNQEHQYSVY